MVATSFTEPAVGALAHTSPTPGQRGELGFTTTQCSHVAAGSGASAARGGTFVISKPHELCYLSFDRVDLSAVTGPSSA